MTGPGTIECVLRLALAALFGGLIGLERELRMKEAGVRTLSLCPLPRGCM